MMMSLIDIDKAKNVDELRKQRYRVLVCKKGIEFERYSPLDAHSAIDSQKQPNSKGVHIPKTSFKVAGQTS